MRQWTYGATIVAVILALAANTARAEPDPGIPNKMSEKIVDELAKTDLDALSGDATKYMGEQTGENIKNNFASIKTLGSSNYTDLVYSRDYGKTSKDFIYKIDFAKAILYVRLLWEVHNGDWRLSHLTFKTETDLPFPAGWEHIYPK
ncbi:MAG TPA: hypothetical protein VM782_20225 [Stellaceae bacterium]|nr:hypothetical protein [Stellaceae bacterium]